MREGREGRRKANEREGRGEWGREGRGSRANNREGEMREGGRGRGGRTREKEGRER